MPQLRGRRVRFLFRAVVVTSLLIACCTRNTLAQGDDTRLREDVLLAIEKGTRYLTRAQKADGSWNSIGAERYQAGVSSLALLALINCGMTPEDEPVRKGLAYLRKLPAGKPGFNYEVSLMISALVAAKDGTRDHALIERLARRLESGQTASGSWGYAAGEARGGDRSNAQFGVLGLRDAASIGYPVDRQVWERARRHWLNSQIAHGGWDYNGGGDASGSMTCAGIATLAITNRMLQDDSLDVRPDGTVDCCRQPPTDEALERGIDWLARSFSVRTNPGHGNWTLYYLYAVERAGRLTGRRFFGRFDWYREGARKLAREQLARGDWNTGGVEQQVVGTSLALLFLSKGLARVVVNKLQYGPPDPRRPGEPSGRDWDNHPDDVRNLVEHISGLRGWPRLLITQTVNMYRLQPDTAVAELSQAPICYISGAQRPAFTEAQAAALRAYVDDGGFILAVATCQAEDFDPGFRELLDRMFPEGGTELKRLAADHPIFRAEYDLDAAGVELYGVDFGCRTPIVYSPVDLACHWNKWMKNEPKGRPVPLKERVIRDTRVGVNIVAYATGREPPVKLHDTGTKRIKGEDRIERGLLEVAKLKHSGGWDTAPRALRNLLLAINETVGLAASTRPKALPIMSDDLFNHPLAYMHGRHAFELSRQEREQLRAYLDRGHVLFADACCGSPQFDRSFRDLMKQMFPETPLKRIPPDHELFTSAIGYDIKTVSRRVPASGRNARFEARVERGEPFLEGIEIDGRLAVIYSKYDISCALERQSTAACRGYIEEDAVKIGINVVLYAMLQDVSWRDRIR